MNGTYLITNITSWHKRINWKWFFRLAGIHVAVRVPTLLMFGYKKSWMVLIDIAVLVLYFVLSVTLLRRKAAHVLSPIPDNVKPGFAISIKSCNKTYRVLEVDQGMNCIVMEEL